jgi:hypothetical protein
MKKVFTEQQLKKIIEKQVINAFLREERIYNLNPLNNKQLCLMNEAYSQINNLDNIIKDIYNTFINNYKMSGSYNEFYKLNYMNSLKHENNYEIDIDKNITVAFKKYIDTNDIKSKYLKQVRYSFSLFFLYEEYINNYNSFSNISFFQNSENRYQFGSDGAYSGDLISLTIPGVIYKDNYYVNLNVTKNLIRHEITHYYQNLLNLKINNNSYENIKFHEKYSKIIGDLNNENKIFKILTNFLYYFHHDEVMANTNQLSGQLSDLGTNKNNYKDIFNKTSVGIEEIFKDKNIDWDEIRNFMQSKDYFEKKSTLGKTRDDSVFKEQLYKLFQNKKEFCNKKFQKTIEYVIGAYKGKRDNEQYTSKNQRLSGQKTYEIRVIKNIS